MLRTTLLQILNNYNNGQGEKSEGMQRKDALKKFIEAKLPDFENDVERIQAEHAFIHALLTEKITYTYQRRFIRSYNTVEEICLGSSKDLKFQILSCCCKHLHISPQQILDRAKHIHIMVFINAGGRTITDKPNEEHKTEAMVQLLNEHFKKNISLTHTSASH